MFFFSKPFHVLFFFVVNVRGQNPKDLVYSRSLSKSVVSMSSCSLKIYTVRSRLDCVRRCFSLDSSIWLKYTKLGPDIASCVCLSTGVRTNISTNTLQETTFSKTCVGDSCNISSGPAWLNKTCTRDADCPAINSVCYSESHSCLCTPGYFYSNTCNICYPDCDSQSLTKSFLKYSHACTIGYDYASSAVSRQQCEAECSANSRCLSYDYNFQKGVCYPSYRTAVTSNTFLPNCTGGIVDYYQKMCI